MKKYLLTYHIILLSIFFLHSFHSLAQNNSIKAVLKSDVSPNEPIPNARILVKGSRIETKTNAQGEFALNIPDSLWGQGTIPLIIEYRNGESYTSYVTAQSNTQQTVLLKKPSPNLSADNNSTDFMPGIEEDFDNTAQAVNNPQDNNQSNPPDLEEEDTDPEEEDIDSLERESIKDNNSNFQPTIEELGKSFEEISNTIDIEKNLLRKGSNEIKQGIANLRNKLKNIEVVSLSPKERDSLQNYVGALEKKLNEYSSAFEESQSEIRNALEQVKAILSEQENRLRINRITIMTLLGIILGLSVLTYFFYYINKRTQRQKAILAENIKKINQQKEEINQQKEKISAQRDSIEQKNQELEFAYTQITDSVVYAERIQKAFLVTPHTLDAFFKDSFVYHVPKDIVSGDFYWFTKKEEELILAVIDCTGHGVPGAFMTIMANDALNHIVHDKGIRHPSDILKQLDTHVQNALHQTGKDEDESKDGMDLMIIKINFKEKQIVISGSRNVLYYIKENQVHQIRGSKYLIGSQRVRGKKTFDSQTVHFDGNEIFYLFTDGFQDQFGGETDEKYLKHRFREFLHSISHLNMDEQRKNLQGEFEYWRGENPQTDDVLVVGIKL